ncbi:MAG: type II toxin-antitoxin system HicB family antitoxin [Desulfomicrobium apsheronum]|nr:type II toxin-antitoxin system HicB family antitoxin [Desulfomicrobium apsheronum]
MNTPMAYNGYSALIEFDNECELLRGEILDINDTITFYANSVDKLKEAMKDAIDDYLEHCAEIGKKPEKPYSGKISLRMTSELHRNASNAATMRGQSINSFVIECIEKKIYGKNSVSSKSKK